MHLPNGQFRALWPLSYALLRYKLFYTPLSCVLEVNGVRFLFDSYML